MATTSSLTLPSEEPPPWTCQQSLRKEPPMSTQLALDPAVAAHIAAINSFDIDAIVATFAENALVNDAHREFWGPEHIRAWTTKEMVGDHVPVEPIEVVDNAGMYAVRCRFDGDYDKTNLP